MRVISHVGYLAAIFLVGMNQNGVGARLAIGFGASKCVLHNDEVKDQTHEKKKKST